MRLPRSRSFAPWLGLALTAWAGACGEEFSSSDAAAGATHAAGADAAAGDATAGTSDAGGAARGGSSHASGGDAGPGAAGAGEAGGAPPTGSAYRDLVLSHHPLVYWRMGEATSRVVVDETGGGNDLVLQGTGQQLGLDGAIRDDADGAIGFDGVKSFAIAKNARALDFPLGAAFSLECWARRVAGGGSYFQHLFSNVQGVANNRDGYALYLLPEPTTGDSARSVLEYDRPMADLGIWGPVTDPSRYGHYVAVFDGDQIALYVDGTLSDSAPVPSSFVARTVPFTVARAAGVDGSYFKGALDELAIYAHALDSVQVAAHYAFARSP
jgi:hypothetical protein